MPWPPVVPPAGRDNTTPQFDNHPSDHNAISAALTDTVNEVSNNRVKTDGSLPMSRLRLTDVSDASLVSVNHALQIGPTGGNNLIFDSNEILGRNNGAGAEVFINSEGGGRVTLGTHPVAGAGKLDVGAGTGPVLCNTDFIVPTQAAGNRFVQAGGDPTSEDGFRARADGPVQSYISGASGAAVGTVNIALARGGVPGGVGGLYMRFSRGAADNTGNSSPIGSIDVNTGGSSVRYNTSSDRRLKDERGLVADAVAAVRRLIPRRFSWKGDPDRTEMSGFFADEVQPVVPEAVVGEPDAVDDDGNISPQMFNASALIPILVAAVQELAARVDELETAAT